MTVFTLFLILHVAAGSVALISSPIAIATQKGGKNHRLAGKAFYYAMLTVTISSFVLAVMHSNIFLFLIGVFSSYLVITGYRILSLKGLDKVNSTDSDSRQMADISLTIKRPAGSEALWIDWAVSGAMMLFGIVLLVYGSWILYKGNELGWVLLVFGVIAVRGAWIDFKLYRHIDVPKHFWLFQHIIRMLAGTIAAYTAFLVVNAHHLHIPNLASWLAPTVLGSFGIAYFVKFYKQKLSGKRG